MSSRSEALPTAWVDRIFERMATVYGVQKMSSMWTGVNPESVKRSWGDALGKYPHAAVAEAVRSMADECGAWPPTLTEFVALVRSKVPAPEHARALPVPKRSDAEIKAGAEQMAKIRAMLASATKRVPARSRVPGEDDE
jgi:hypothetical protein